MSTAGVVHPEIECTCRFRALSRITSNLKMSDPLAFAAAHEPRSALGTPERQEGSTKTELEDEHFSAVIVVADIVGFTSMAERLTAQGNIGIEQLSQILNAYFTRLRFITAAGKWQELIVGEPLAQIRRVIRRAKPGDVVLSPQVWAHVYHDFNGERLAQ